MNPPTEASRPSVILASASKSRAHILRAAGVPHTTVPANIDESAVKRALARNSAPALAVAETLALQKAQHVSQSHRGAFVIGADQVLECDGRLFDKPADIEQARAHLCALRGKRHTLAGSISLVRDGVVIWQHNDQAHLDMRELSDAFIEWYTEQMGDQICETVGAYKLEGIGAQLFETIDGDFFSILGLPLLPLLDVLRRHGVMPS
ncbi:MAG: Maf family protein [Alphaproteobacteria bacterium]|nr:Maf family protein [Alphaproteobacteria bacterium]